MCWQMHRYGWPSLRWRMLWFMCWQMHRHGGPSLRWRMRWWCWRRYVRNIIQMIWHICIFFIQATLVYSWNQSLLSSGCTKVDRPCNPKRHPTSSQCCKGLYCQAYGPNINPGGRCQYPRIQPEPRILSTHRGTKSK